MQDDKYYQQAEFLIAKGYLPGADVNKIAEKLQAVEQKSAMNRTETVYSDDVLEMIKKISDVNSTEILTEVERAAAIANGNLKVG